MLKGISPLLSPELLKVLAEMGHGDVIVIADANFPVKSFCEAGGAVNVRADGHSATDILTAVLDIMPVDAYVQHPFTIMQKTAQDKDLACPIWDDFKAIAGKYDERGADAFEQLERFTFYDFAKTAYAIVQTGERALYGNIAIRKGVIS